MTHRANVEFVLRHLDGRTFARTSAAAFDNLLSNLWPWAVATVAEEFDCQYVDVSEKALANGMAQITVCGKPVAEFVSTVRLGV